MLDLRHFETTKADISTSKHRLLLKNKVFHPYFFCVEVKTKSLHFFKMENIL